MRLWGCYPPDCPSISLKLPHRPCLFDARLIAPRLIPLPPSPPSPAGGVYEDPRKLANLATRAEARDCQLDQEEAGLGVIARVYVIHCLTHTISERQRVSFPASLGGLLQRGACASAAAFVQSLSRARLHPEPPHSASPSSSPAVVDRQAGRTGGQSHFVPIWRMELRCVGWRSRKER